MTFDEIADKLGITKQRAQRLFETGIRKLRMHHPLALCRLRQLSNELQREKAKRQPAEFVR